MKSLFNVRNLKSLKNDVMKAISKEATLKGVNNIKNELEKRKIDATVTCKQHRNSFTYSIEPKAQDIDSEDLSPKEAAKIKKLFGPVPLEMFNQEVSKKSIPDRAIDIALEKTQEEILESVEKVIKNIL